MSRFHNRTVCLASLVLISLTFGCVTTDQQISTQQTMMSIQEQNRRLEERVNTLERELRGGSQGTTSGAQSLADLSSRIQQLQVELGSLKGQVEEQSQRLDRLAGVPVSGPGPASMPSPTMSSDSRASSVVISTPSPAVSQPAIPEDPEKAQYTRALQLFREHKYEAARNEFGAFLDTYPKSDLADNALFWIGDSYFAENSYRKAIESYQQVLDRYPRGNKVPAALLQQGNAFSKLGDKTAARILYQRVMDRYPNSPQANVAANKLKDL